jgi:hypothetical protein
MQMQRLTLLALLVRGAEASELSCRPDGVTDTSLTFKGKTMSVNNLGGLGVGCQGYLCSTSISQCNCDTWATGASAEDAPIMRFDGVGRAGTHTAAPGASFDLVVTNLTEYMPWTYQWTGLIGSFGSIGLNGPKADTDPQAETTFEFCAVLSGRPYTEHFVLDSLGLTIYDLCAPGHHSPCIEFPSDATRFPVDRDGEDGFNSNGVRDGKEEVLWKGYEPGSLFKGNQVEQGTEGEWTTLGAKNYGTGKDNPEYSHDNLTDTQRQRSIGAVWKVRIAALPNSN